MSKSMKLLAVMGALMGLIGCGGAEQPMPLQNEARASADTEAETLEQGLALGDIVALRCAHGACSTNHGCLYAEQTTLYNGYPIVRRYDCSIATTDARFKWKLLTTPYPPHVQFQNQADGRCLYAYDSSGNHQLVTVPCNYWDGRQAWTNIPLDNYGLGHQLKNHTSQRCAHPSWNSLSNGTPMHDWPCTSDTYFQDWTVIKL